MSPLREHRKLLLGLAAVLGAFLAALQCHPRIPTGRLGYRILNRIVPPSKALNLQAATVALRFPTTVQLSSVSITSGIKARTDRMEITLSPWQLMRGKARITGISTSCLVVHTRLEAQGILATLSAIDTIPLRQWLPPEFLPRNVRIDTLRLQTPKERMIAQLQGVSLKSNGARFSLHADSVSLLALLHGGHLDALGRLPLQLDTFHLGLPGGFACGHLTKDPKSLGLYGKASLELHSIPLPLPQARLSGRAEIHKLHIQIPLDAQAPELNGTFTTTDLRLAGFSWAEDPWIRRFTPELSSLTFQRGTGTLNCTPSRLMLREFKAANPVLRVQTNGWLELDGNYGIAPNALLAFPLDVSLSPQYARSRPGLLRAALRTGSDGWGSTEAKLQGTLAHMRLEPGKAAYAHAISHPLESLKALLF